jgi:peptidoglycan-associated lipoprotein
LEYTYSPLGKRVMSALRNSSWNWPATTFRRAPGFLRLSLQLFLISAFVALLSGCPPAKTPVVQTPPPPAAPAPTATIDATPAEVQQGQPVTITWKTENASDISISQIGAVQPTGSQTITPTESTTYHLSAKGPGGVHEADARVTVVRAAAAQVPSPTNEGALSDAATRLDVFFDLDDYVIRPDQTPTIQADAQFLKQHPEISIVVEGHCDEMGSTEYNIVLGEKRAAEVKAALEKVGVSSSRMRTISYGKEQPVCTEQTEDCWRRNRRAHITPDVQR